MSKYSKIYIRNKKQSNISSPHRYSFLASIFVDHMSVKNAALKWKIHYSSAKIIARLAKKSNLQTLFKQNKKPTVACSWKEIPPNKTLSPPAPCQKEILACDSTQSFQPQTLTSTSPQKIDIVSRVGWSYTREQGCQLPF